MKAEQNPAPRERKVLHHCKSQYHYKLVFEPDDKLGKFVVYYGPKGRPGMCAKHARSEHEAWVFIQALREGFNLAHLYLGMAIPAYEFETNQETPTNP
jgi:hypothetical protein